MDKWKLNVLAAIKRKLDTRAGVTEQQDTMQAKGPAQNQYNPDPEFSPF